MKPETKIKNENYQGDPDLVRLYGSLEAYNEEQRRCGLAVIEEAVRANPFTPQVRVETLLPFEAIAALKTKPEGRPSWFNLPGKRAFSKLSLKIYRLYKQ